MIFLDESSAAARELVLSSRHRIKPILLIVLAVALLLISTGHAYGADASEGTDHETIQQLVKANRALVQHVQELEARMKQMEEKSNATPAVTSAAVTTPVAASPVLASLPSIKPSIAPEVSPVQEPFPHPSPEGIKLRLFGDVGYRASDQKTMSNTFRAGSTDMLMTGSLSDRLSILAEIHFIGLSDNSINIDVERLLLQYRHNDYLNFAIGRYHSSIGYYNTAFHQGAWFETAIDRPFMYDFDDMQGFLPLQEVGITINGQIPSGSLGLNYVAEVGNGRSHLLGSEPAQNGQDTNNGKSVNIALFARPSWARDVQVGFSVYHDYLTFSDHVDHSELISTVYAVYRNTNYEILNEGLLVRHGTTSTGGPGVFHTPGFYSQISRRFGKYRPYFRYAYVNAGTDEPIYGDPLDGPVVGRRNGPCAGLRYDFNDHAAVKFQFDHFERRGEDSVNRLATQFSFAF